MCCEQNISFHFIHGSLSTTLSFNFYQTYYNIYNIKQTKKFLKRFRGSACAPSPPWLTPLIYTHMCCASCCFQIHNMRVEPQSSYL